MTARKGCPSASAVSHRPRLHPAHAFLFSRDSDFLFSVWAWCGEGRVSPKGETGGIHSVVISFFVVLKMDSVLRKLFSGDLDFRKTETNFVFAFCPRGGGVWGGIRAG